MNNINTIINDIKDLRGTIMDNKIKVVVVDA